MARSVRYIRAWGRALAPREAELVSAAAYGTVLVLSALTLVTVTDVASGYGLELVAGIGAATYIAHLFAETVGHQLHERRLVQVSDVTDAAIDGCPILLAALIPGMVIGAGRLQIIADETAIWIGVAVAAVQLVGLGAYVGSRLPGRRTLPYAIGTTLVGVVVVAIKLLLGH
jgi:hypothetical protein